jgi:hypothetical protein
MASSRVMPILLMLGGTVGNLCQIPLKPPLGLPAMPVPWSAVAHLQGAPQTRCGVHHWFVQQGWLHGLVCKGGICSHLWVCGEACLICCSHARVHPTCAPG